MWSTAIAVLSGKGPRTRTPEMILSALDRWSGKFELIGMETGSTSPWLAQALKALGLPVVVMDAHRVAKALEARPVNTHRKDARALAEMLHAGWFTAVFVKSEEPSVEGLVDGTRSAGPQQAQPVRPDPGPAAALRGPVRDPSGQQEV